MSAAVLLQPVTGAMRRALCRAWLRFRIRSAERDVAGIKEQMRKDIAQARVYRERLGAWRVELAITEELRR